MITIITLLIEWSLLALFRGMGTIDIGNVTATVLILLFSLAFVLHVIRSRVLQKYRLPVLFGYFWRVFLLYFDLFGNKIYQLPNSGADSAMFYRTSTELFLYGATNRTSNFTATMAFLYRCIGMNRLYAQFLLMLLSVLTICLFVRLLEQIELGEGVKQRAVFVLAILPNYAILSSIFLRESVVTLLIFVCVISAVKWMRGGSELWFFAAILSSAAGAFFHSGAIGAAIGCVLIRMLYDKRSRSIRMRAVNIVAAVVVAVVGAFFVLNYQESLLGKFADVDTIDDIANDAGLGGSSYAHYVGDSSSLPRMLLYTIPRIVYFLFSPFPWQWRGVSDIIAFVFNSVFYFLTLWSVWKYLRAKKKENQAMLIGLLAVAVMITLIFAWGTSNTGTATRHRDKMFPVYVLLWAMSQTREPRYALTIAGRRFA